MTSLQDIEMEGVTVFSSATSYRYVIELKSSKLSIWMEDRSSKKQWLKGGMDKTSYVFPSNAIPDASLEDYAKCFQETLDGDLENSSDAQRKLLKLDGGSLRLELIVKVRVFRSTWLAKYAFDLDPVSVEHIDVLESKLRDQQEELEKLRKQQEELLNFGNQKGGLDKLRSEQNVDEAPPFIKLTTSNKHGSSILCWNPVEIGDFVATGLDGVVKAVRGGTYTIAAIISIISGMNQAVLLRKNGKTIQMVWPGCSQGCHTSAPLNTIERLKKNDELTIMCVCELVDTSYLTIVRLGD